MRAHSASHISCFRLAVFWQVDFSTISMAQLQCQPRPCSLLWSQRLALLPFSRPAFTAHNISAIRRGWPVGVNITFWKPNIFRPHNHSTCHDQHSLDNLTQRSAIHLPFTTSTSYHCCTNSLCILSRQPSSCFDSHTADKFHISKLHHYEKASPSRSTHLESHRRLLYVTGSSKGRSRCVDFPSKRFRGNCSIFIDISKPAVLTK